MRIEITYTIANSLLVVNLDNISEVVLYLK